MKPTIEELKVHIDNDPNGIGLGFDKVPNNHALLALLHQEEFGDIEDKKVLKGDFVRKLTPSILKLRDAKATNVVKILEMIDAGIVDCDDAGVAAILDSLVSDGAMNDAEKISVTTRKGTYAEAVWGRGTTFTRIEIQKAREL